MASRDGRDVVIRISAKNLTKGEIDKARRQLDKLEKSASGANRKISPLQKEVRRLGENFTQMNPAAASASRLLGGAGVAALGLTAGVAGLAVGVGASVRHVTQLGVELTTLRDKTGISLGGLQELKFVAEQTNVGFDRLTDATVRLGRRAASELPEAVKGLDKLGLSVSDILAKEPSDAFRSVVDELAKLPTQAEKSARAMEIFGDAGLQILPLLEADIDGLTQSFHDLGGSIDDDVLEAGRRFDDAMTDLKASLTGLAGEIAGPLISSLADLAEAFVKAQKEASRLNVDLFEEDPTLRKLGRERLSIIGPGIQNEGDARRLKEVDEEIRLRKEVLAQIKEVEAALFSKGKAEAQVGDVSKKTSTERDKALREEQKRLKELEKEYDRLLGNLRGGIGGQFHIDLVDANAELARFNKNLQEGLGEAGIGGRFSNFAHEWEKLQDEIEGAKGETDDLKAAQDAYNEALSAAADLTTIIGGNLGRLVGQTFGAAAALQNLASIGGEGGILGGLGGAFKSGKGDAGGILGFLGGVGGLTSAIGPLIGLGSTLASAIKGLLGRDARDVAKDVGRDIGTQISDGLAEQILKSGQSAQFFLKEIFQEGGLGIDQLAREVGDLFSFFERGDISREGLLGELKETLPILIANFGELGPSGQAEIDRITAAAERFGIKLDELDQLMQAAFAPDTLETIAEKFDLTNDQVRALAEKLGVDVQTNLERMAATLGLSVEQFQSLGEAVEKEFGLPLDQIDELLASMGVSAEDLAAALGIDLGDVTSGTETAAAETEAAANWAALFADEMERANRAAGGISFNLPGLPGGILMQHGGIGETHRPTPFISSEHGQREGFAFFPGGLPSTLGARVEISAPITLNLSGGGGGGGGMSDAQADALLRRARQNLGGFADELAAAIEQRLSR